MYIAASRDTLSRLWKISIVVRISVTHVEHKPPARVAGAGGFGGGHSGDVRLSHRLGAGSTIGAAGLNGRVRDGNGWSPRARVTRKGASSWQGSEEEGLKPFSKRKE